jgi:glycosyltransferase involved in cell wall biosynthesis
VANLLRQATDTIAHSHGYHADLVGWLAARAARRPIVATVHGYTGGDRKNRFYEWLDGYILRRVDRAIAVARPLAERLARVGVPAARLVVLPNAWVPAVATRPRLEARRLLGIPDAATVVGWVGRLTPEKGPDLFVDAIARLPVAIHGAVIGDGAMRAGLADLARRRGLEGRLRWHGVAPEAGRLLPAFDVLALSSRSEGTPIVLLEAMAAGVPVVATAVGGVPEVAPGGEILLVPPGDPAALAAALLRCLERGDETRARVEAAQRRVAEAYAPDPWLDRYETVYRSLACR